MPRNPSSILITTTAPPLLLFLLLMLSSFTLLFLFHLSFFPPSSSSSSPSPPPLLLRACNATRFPSLCLSTLPSSSSSSSVDLIHNSISLSSTTLPQAQSIITSILSSSSSNPSRAAAARDCAAHLTLSSARLARAASAFPRATASARVSASAALLYQYDCWSALKYVNSSRQIASAMVFISNLTSVTSNALALISAFHRYGADVSLWSPPLTERDGYWEDGDRDGSASLRSAGGIPRNLVPDIAVCRSAQCRYQSVQEAVSAAPDNSPRLFVIRVAAGFYNEIVRIPFEKTNIVLLGDGMGKTVITNSLNVAKMTAVTTYDTATFGVDGDGFMAANLTFENTAGAGAHQAVAFRSDSDLSILESVEFLGHQDTLYARSMRQFYRNCRISGTIDFIFGNSASFLQDCSIEIVPRLGSPEKGETNAVTAHGRTDPAQPTGFVFAGCVVNGSDEYMALYYKKPRVHRNYLGRPWKEYARTVFMESVLGEIVRPEGWLPWRGEFALTTLFYGEFGCSGPGAAAAARVPWSSQIPAEHVGAYSVKNFIQGDEWIPPLN